MVTATLLAALILASDEQVTLKIPKGSDKPAVLVKESKFMGKTNTTKGVFFTGYVDNMQFCQWMVDKLRADPGQGGSAGTVTWYCQRLD